MTRCRRYNESELAEMDAEDTFDVTVRELPETTVACLRITNSYDVQRTIDGYNRFIEWVRSTFGGLHEGTLIGMSHDDPDVTPPELCRYDYCWTVQSGFRTTGEISVRTLPACRVAAVRIDGDVERLSKAWDYLYRYWLPRSRWQPASLPGMEMYRRTPEETGWTWFDLDGCVPVEPV